MRNGGLRRGLTFELTIESAWNLFLAQGKRCAFTGMELTLAPNNMRAGASTASLDRIDSSKGYIEGNVQWVHVTINLMKQTLSDADFIHWCGAVTAYAHGATFGKNPVKGKEHLY